MWSKINITFLKHFLFEKCDNTAQLARSLILRWRFGESTFLSGRLTGAFGCWPSIVAVELSVITWSIRSDRAAGGSCADRRAGRHANRCGGTEPGPAGSCSTRTGEGSSGLLRPPPRSILILRCFWEGVHLRAVDEMFPIDVGTKFFLKHNVRKLCYWYPLGIPDSFFPCSEGTLSSVEGFHE